MTRALGLTAAAIAFIVVATANAGGYRFGISDQAFYVPAVALRMTPALFPRDRAVLEPQMRVWLGDDLLAAATHLAGGDMPAVFLAVYVVTLLVLFSTAVMFARGMGASWWVIAGFLALLTLRHRIARTGANSLEGYMHPRMLAFAIGVGALAAIARQRFLIAFIAILLAGAVHPTTAIWFGGLWLAAVVVAQGFGRWLAIALGAAAVASVGLALWPATFHLDVMDAPWLAVLADKDYLFSTDWPAYAWLANLGSVAVVVLTYRRRSRLGVTAPAEGALVAGAVALVGGFLVSLPLTVAHVAFAVQLQINRVFWLVDFLVAWSLAWWLVEDVAARRPRWLPAAAVTALVFVAIARGYYVLAVEAQRPLFQIRLASSTWTDAMAFLRTGPVAWRVLADPAHGWKYGVSVRVAAERDVLLESGKDTSMSMYDRDVARRVAERQAALDGFDRFGVADVRALADRFQLDVFVDRVDRALDLPVLYKNADFVVYALR